MAEQILRAACALIVVTGLIFWLAKAATQNGKVAQLLHRVGTQPTQRTTARSTRGAQGSWALLGSQFKTAVKGFGAPSTSRKQQPLVTVAAHQTLNARASIAVVDVDGQRMVLGISEGSVNLLSQYDQPTVIPEPAAEPASNPEESAPQIHADTQDFDNVLAGLLRDSDTAGTNALTHG